MQRDELLKSREYWITKIQIDLFNQIEQYMKTHGLNRTQLAQQLGVSKGYITQVLNGDYDHRISKLVELSLAIGMVPEIQFKSTDEYISTFNDKTSTQSSSATDYPFIHKQSKLI